MSESAAKGSSSIESVDDKTTTTTGTDQPPQKLRVRRRKLSELAPWEIWRCVRCGKCYSKTSKAAILEHVRVLCQAGVHDDEEIRRQMALYARKQGGWIYSGKKMGLANTYNMNNYTLAPNHPAYGAAFGQQQPFSYFPQTPAVAAPINARAYPSQNFHNGVSPSAEPSTKRPKYESSTPPLAVAAVKTAPRSLSTESSSSSGGTSPGSRASPINHLSQEPSRPQSNENNPETNGNKNPPSSAYPAASYPVNEFGGYGGEHFNPPNAYSNNYPPMNYGYVNVNYPFAQQNYSAPPPPPAGTARRATITNPPNEISDYRAINFQGPYPPVNNFVPRNTAAQHY